MCHSGITRREMQEEADSSCRKLGYSQGYASYGTLNNWTRSEIPRLNVRKSLLVCGGWLYEDGGCYEGWDDEPGKSGFVYQCTSYDYIYLRCS